jgi:hypothetical protein
LRFGAPCCFGTPCGLGAPSCRLFALVLDLDRLLFALRVTELRLQVIPRTLENGYDGLLLALRFLEAFLFDYEVLVQGPKLIERSGLRLVCKSEKLRTALTVHDAAVENQRRGGVCSPDVTLNRVVAKQVAEFAGSPFTVCDRPPRACEVLLDHSGLHLRVLVLRGKYVGLLAQRSDTGASSFQVTLCVGVGRCCEHDDLRQRNQNGGDSMFEHDSAEGAS